MAKDDQLEFKESFTHIPEVLGMNSDLAFKITSDIAKAFAVNGLLDDCKLGRTGVLDKYLQSDDFKRHNFTPKTANDFFMLGYCFKSAMVMEDQILEKMKQVFDKIEGKSTKPTGEDKFIDTIMGLFDKAEAKAKEKKLEKQDTVN